MTIEQQVLEKLRELSLRSRRKCWILWTLSRARTPQKLLGAAFRGLWEDLNINITEEDIAEARREMWATPRPTAGSPRSMPSDRRTSNYLVNPLAIF
jgi:hypothetical protein